MKKWNDNAVLVDFFFLFCFNTYRRTEIDDQLLSVSSCKCAGLYDSLCFSMSKSERMRAYERFKCQSKKSYTGACASILCFFSTKKSNRRPHLREHIIQLLLNEFQSLIFFSLSSIPFFSRESNQSFTRHSLYLFRVCAHFAWYFARYFYDASNEGYTNQAIKRSYLWVMFF